ncbi:helix-turn-helix domain-containing protein [Streptosporangium canum]|uniref:helix-turn-helix domain-containing protein n=1 Tax=Streptosporangium canum TaxID=324952 RepID=UPI00369DF208
MEDEQRSPGEVLRHNIRRIREGQRLTYVELAERLKDAGRPIPVLGLRRVERGERRVDVDDLLALAYVLGVAVVDLLVPGDEPDSMPYDVAPARRVPISIARAWIGGQGFLSQPITPSELAHQLQWMPKDRAETAVREWLEPEDRAWLAEAEKDHQGQEERGTDGRSDQEN